MGYGTPNTNTPLVSTSRKVRGYVKAVERLRRLRHKVEVAEHDVLARRATLNGGQLAEALRLTGNTVVLVRE